MKRDEARPLGKDPAAHPGTRTAIKRAFGGPLIVDAAADAAFAGMIARLRTEPGSHQGGKQ